MSTYDRAHEVIREMKHTKAGGHASSARYIRIRRCGRASTVQEARVKEEMVPRKTDIVGWR
jgi:hypothetical protein